VGANRRNFGLRITSRCTLKTVMHQGLRDQGSRSKSGQTLESSDSGPGFRGSGTAGGEVR